MCKDVFIDRHECLGVVEDCKNLLIQIKDHKLYMIKFEENGAINLKMYPSDYVVRDKN